MNGISREETASSSSRAATQSALPPSAEPSALNEPILPDDYPIYADYLYVADGRVVRSDWHGITARQFRSREGFTELRRCDIEGRRAAIAAAEGRS